MDRTVEYVRSSVVNYKLNSCCWIVPIRIGVLIIGYFNLITAMISLVGTANDSFSPTIKKVQEVIMEEASTSMCILAYATDLGANVLLLCAMYRNDIILLRAYMYYSIAAMIMAILVYSMVIAAIDVLIKIVIIMGTLFQCYIILLVRSAIVEIKEANSLNKNGIITKQTIELPKVVPDVEAPVEQETEPVPETEHNVDSEATKLDTIAENPKEEKKDGK